MTMVMMFIGVICSAFIQFVILTVIGILTTYIGNFIIFDILKKRMDQFDVELFPYSSWTLCISAVLIFIIHTRIWKRAKRKESMMFFKWMISHENIKWFSIGFTAFTQIVLLIAFTCGGIGIMFLFLLH